eukprot:803535-Pelagomonas_calceolata.AAC.3
MLGACMREGARRSYWYHNLGLTRNRSTMKHCWVRDENGTSAVYDFRHCTDKQLPVCLFIFSSLAQHSPLQWGAAVQQGLQFCCLTGSSGIGGSHKG